MPAPCAHRFAAGLRRRGCHRHRQDRLLRQLRHCAGPAQAVLRGQQRANAEAHEEPRPQDVAVELNVTADEVCHRVHPILVAHQCPHVGREAVEARVQLKVSRSALGNIRRQSAPPSKQQGKVARRHLSTSRDAASARPHEADPRHALSNLWMEDVLEEPSDIAVRDSQRCRGPGDCALQEGKDILVTGAKDEALAFHRRAIVKMHLFAFQPLDRRRGGADLARCDVADEGHVLASELLAPFALARPVAPRVDEACRHVGIGRIHIQETR
mmetsp:Transcript_92658/g.215315  ORF Transcript_92658/g.215315 Transcript_92658/m.215315 type:complete len:270 (+) Transcript_92658:156-965(+)